MLYFLICIRFFLRWGGRGDRGVHGGMDKLGRKGPLEVLSKILLKSECVDQALFTQFWISVMMEIPQPLWIPALTVLMVK